jgi:hypothetical protein
MYVICMVMFVVWLRACPRLLLAAAHSAGLKQTADDDQHNHRLVFIRLPGPCTKRAASPPTLQPFLNATTVAAVQSFVTL